MKILHTLKNAMNRLYHKKDHRRNTVVKCRFLFQIAAQIPAGNRRDTGTSTKILAILF